MSINVSRRYAHKAVALRFLVAGFLMCPIATFAGTGDESVAVFVDQAKVVKLPEKVATIVVGNPLIADVNLQPGGMVVVTGKGYGSTNMIAMDRAGRGSRQPFHPGRRPGGQDGHRLSRPGA